MRGVEAHKDRARQYRAAMSDLQVAMSDLQVVYDDVIAAGDKVASRWTARGTHDGELQGIPPTGRKIVITGISIDRFDESGKLVETWDQWDSAGFAAQLGITPEAAAQSG